MIEVSKILKIASEKSGFIRSRYAEKNIPSDPSKITVFFFFGNLRSSVILSSILLKRYREEVKGSKYFIMCSWPGFSALYPYVDEYWEIIDVPFLSRLLYQSNEFENNSEELVPFRRNLNYYFEDVVDEKVIKPYYNNGITQDFWNRFKHVKKYLPVIASSNILGEMLNNSLSVEKTKIFVSPTRYCYDWKRGRSSTIHCPREFWIALIRRIIGNGMLPVVLQNWMTHDIFSEISDGIVLLSETNMMKILSAMRSTDCVVDAFNSMSRLAAVSRSPFLACDSRNRYNMSKEWEINGLLCVDPYPAEYIYSFPTILNTEERTWDSLFDIAMKKLQKFAMLNKDSLPSTSEVSEIVPYKSVQIHKSKKMGIKFIKVERY